MNVNLIIDSTTDLRPGLRERFTIVPLTVHFGDQEYIDGVTTCLLYTSDAADE